LSGSRPTVGIRISAEGADQARRQIEAIGPAGEAAMRRVATASAAAAPEMQRLALASDVANRAFVGMGGSLGRVGATFTGVSGVAAGLTAGFVALGAAASLGAAQIAKAGDAATAVLARLSSASGGLAQAQQVYEQLFRLSQQTGIAVAESAGAFSRFSVAAKEIGGTNDQVLRLVAGIQKAGIVAGASAQETGAAVQQLGQALASGRLQGDELRSLLENMPQLAQALAGELGVGIGRLREMGAEGKLTADTVFPALLRATERIGAEFDKMPVTMSRAKDILLAATEDFGARLDRITGLSQTFARFMQQGASALGAAGRLIAPSEREAADAAVEAAQRQRSNVARQVAAERAASAYGTVAPGLQQALDIADEDLRAALARQQDILRQDRELRRAEAQDAAAQARQSAQAAATLALKDLAGDLDARFKAREKYAEQIKKIDEAEARGGTLPQGVSFASLRAAASRELADALAKEGRESAKAGDEAAKAAEKRQDVIEKLNLQVRAAEEALAGTLAGTAASRDASIALETENQIRAAGIPDVERRTEAEKRAAEAIGASVAKLSDLKAANKEAEEAAKKAREWHDRSWNELAGIGERAFDRLGDAIVQAFVSGQGAAVNFGNVARAILSSVVADIAKLAVVNPVLNSIFPSTQPRATLSGAFGGSGGLGDLLGLSGLMPDGGLMGALGLAGVGSTVLIPGLTQTTSAALGAMGGLYGPASAAQLAATGGSLASGLTVSGLFGGAGAGFGAGMLLNSLVGGNQTGGMIGSGLGAAGGAILGSIIPGIGTLIGGLIGGAAGGGLGGLFGPGESLRGYGLRLQSSAYDPAVGGTTAFGTGLLPIDRTFYDDEGRAVFAQAEQQVAATNAYLSSRNLRVAGASIVGGNRNGPDYSWADAGTVGEGFSRLRFSAADNAELDQQLRQRNFQGVEGLQAYVEGFTQAQEAIKALAGEAMPQFTAQMRAVNDNFEAAARQARAYGIAETTLTEARAKAVAALEAQRAETLRQSDVALSIRRLAAAGSSLEADLARQTEQARQELDSFGRSLDALALTAADKSARLVQLEEVQAAERAAIIARYGEQAAQALRQAGGSIRAYLDSLATGTAAGASPTDRLNAAMSAFMRDRTLALGGDRDALGRITGTADSLLSAGRDVYASGGGFQQILEGVRANLGGLPVVQSYDAQQAESLQAIQQVITAGTLNTSTVILPAGNTVQLAGGLDLGAVVAALGTANQSLGNVVGTLVSGLGAIAQNTGNTVGTLLGVAQAANDNAGFIVAAQAAGNTIAANAANAHSALLGAVAHGVHVLIANDIGHAASTLNALGTLAALQASYGNATLASLAVLAVNSVAGFNGVAAALQVMASNDVASAVSGHIRLDNINQSLGTAHLSITDVNASLSVVHAAIVNGSGFVAANVSIASAAQVAAQGAGNIIAVDAAGRAQTAMAVLATVAADGAAAQVAAQGVGNTIAANAASAHSVLLSGATSYLASIAATVTAMLATETLGVRYAAATAYNTRLSAGPGGIMIAGEAPAPATGTGGLAYGGGAGRPGSGATTLPGINESAAILSYTAQRLGGPAAGGVGSQEAGAAAGPGAAMVQELQALRAAVLALQATTQQGAVLVAQETRASGQAVAGALDDQTTLMRREAA